MPKYVRLRRPRTFVKGRYNKYGTRKPYSGRSRARRMRAVHTARPARFRNVRTGGFLGQELKFYDTKLVSGALTAPTDASGGEHDPSATIVLNSVTQGDGEQQRDGRKMTMKSIYLNGILQVPSQSGQSAADAGSQVFIALVLDTQTNGATIVSEQVFTNKGASAVLAASPMRNLEFVSRYKVLKIKKINLSNPNITNDTGATGGVIQNGLVRAWKMYSMLGDLGVTFNGTTETVANITDNSLHILAWCNNVGLAPTISYNARLRFMG